MRITKKHFLTALKLIVSAGLIYLIYKKIDVQQMLQSVKKASPLYLGLAVVFFVFSKLTAAFRLNMYFQSIQGKLKQLGNLKLYLLGMFYNLFLPGGIGGDAYKVWLLKKKFALPSKKLIAIMLLDRLSGLTLICILTALITLFVPNELVNRFQFLILLGIPVAVIVFRFLSKKMLLGSFSVIWKSLGYSFVVQTAQLVSVFFILKSLDITTQNWEYLFIFFVSSIVSVLPVSIGGVGLREATFFYGAQFLMLHESTAIAVSFLFFAIQAITSLFGIAYHFKAPALELAEHQ